MVMAVARFLGLELDLKKIDLSKKEQLNPEFVKVSRTTGNFADL